MVTLAPSPRWDTGPDCPHNTVSDSFTVHCYTQPQGLPSTPHGHILAGGRYTTTSTPQHNPVRCILSPPSTTPTKLSKAQTLSPHAPTLGPGREVATESQPAVLVSTPAVHPLPLSALPLAHNVFLRKFLNPTGELRLMLSSRRSKDPLVCDPQLDPRVSALPPPHAHPWLPVGSVRVGIPPRLAMPSAPPSSRPLSRVPPSATPSVVPQPGVGRGPTALTAFFFLRLCRRLTTRSV